MQEIKITITSQDNATKQTPSAATLQKLVQEITKTEGPIGMIKRDPQHADTRACPVMLTFRYMANGALKDPTHEIWVDCR